jgi:hypothetical protein
VARGCDEARLRGVRLLGESLRVLLRRERSLEFRRAFVDALNETIGDRASVVELDAHINDPEFADRAVDTLLGMMQ